MKNGNCFEGHWKNHGIVSEQKKNYEFPFFLIIMEN